MIYEFEGVRPSISDSAFIHPQATVIGDVTIGKDVYIGPHATIRGDFGRIEIADGCNVQESCTIHMFPGVTVVLEKDAHVGHGAIVHGARVGENVLVGMNAVLMDDVVVGRNSIIGALAMVPAEMEIPEQSLVVGNPAKIVKQVSDEMVEWKRKGTALYQALPKRMRESMKEVEQSEHRQLFNRLSKEDYSIWKKTKK